MINGCSTDVQAQRLFKDVQQRFNGCSTGSTGSMGVQWRQQVQRRFNGFQHIQKRIKKHKNYPNPTYSPHFYRHRRVLCTDVLTPNIEVRGFPARRILSLGAMGWGLGTVSELLEWETSPSSMYSCLLYTSPSPRDGLLVRMPSSG